MRERNTIAKFSSNSTGATFFEKRLDIESFKKLYNQMKTQRGSLYFESVKDQFTEYELQLGRASSFMDKQKYVDFLKK